MRDHWRAELEEMRLRVVSNRRQLCEALSGIGFPRPAFGGGNGMFSMLPLSRQAIDLLATDHAIYLPPTGRINLAALTLQSISFVATAMDDVLNRVAS